jgi:hypothetical protein
MQRALAQKDSGVRPPPRKRLRREEALPEGWGPSVQPVSVGEILDSGMREGQAVDATEVETVFKAEDMRAAESQRDEGRTEAGDAGNTEAEVQLEQTAQEQPGAIIEY